MGRRQCFGRITGFLWGTLLPVCPSWVIYSSGIPLTAHVSRLLAGNFWVWPSARSSAIMEIQTLATSHVTPSHLPDTILWIPSKTGQYHLGSTWNYMRCPKAKVSWFSLIWNKDMVSRHSFICWLAILNRLSTRDRQHKYCSSISPLCVFCD